MQHGQVLKPQQYWDTSWLYLVVLHKKVLLDLRCNVFGCIARQRRPEYVLPNLCQQQATTNLWATSSRWPKNSVSLELGFYTVLWPCGLPCLP